jgi:tetratricopeptide (TPR) repeat protein
LDKNYLSAILEYNRAISENNKFIPAIINIGIIKYEEGDKQGAIFQWQQAIEINNQVAESILALAVALYSQGKEAEAHSLAEKALKLDKNTADVKFLRKNLWGDKLIADTQRLLSTNRIKRFLSQKT